tara:strand:- start:4295 stop:5176 length:882 start_codon:yes stop_codon:yes gene_type:complete
MILVTGATGFIGKKLVRTLVKKHKVLCIVRDKKKLSFKHKNLQIKEGNITDKQFLEKITTKINCIIHLAAITDAKSKELSKVNILGTKNLVEITKKNKIKKFIYISTENIQYNCKDAYTQSKKQAENIVKTLKHYTILREPIVYGSGDTKYIGKLVALIKKNKIIPIPGNGTYLVQPVYVDDLVHCIQKTVDKPIYGTYTIVGKQALTYETIVNILIKELQLKRTKIHIPLSLLKLASILLPLIFVQPPLTYTQLCNLAINRKHDIKTISKTFNYTPLSFIEGIQKLKKTEHL